MKNILINIIKFYQNNISYLKPPCCRFYPSCSQYSIEAISLHGIFKGLIISFFRILRCNPLFKGGIDHVPSTFRIKKLENKK